MNSSWACALLAGRVIVRQCFELGLENCGTRIDRRDCDSCALVLRRLSGCEVSRLEKWVRRARIRENSADVHHSAQGQPCRICFCRSSDADLPGIDFSSFWLQPLLVFEEECPTHRSIAPIFYSLAVVLKPKPSAKTWRSRSGFFVAINFCYVMRRQ
jgi:hypothetical protein